MTTSKGKTADHTGSGTLIRHRPQTEGDWLWWYGSRELARKAIRENTRRRKRSKDAETLIAALGLDSDRWGEEVSANDRISAAVRWRR